MANHIKDDNGKWVLAVGAPGSLERVKVTYPNLISKLNNLYCNSCDCYGRAVDEAIQMIRKHGIKSPLETKNILLASYYSNEKAGSVTDLVVNMS